MLIQQDHLLPRKTCIAIVPIIILTAHFTLRPTTPESPCCLSISIFQSTATSVLRLATRTTIYPRKPALPLSLLSSSQPNSHHAQWPQHLLVLPSHIHLSIPCQISIVFGQQDHHLPWHPRFAIVSVIIIPAPFILYPVAQNRLVLLLCSHLPISCHIHLSITCLTGIEFHRHHLPW